MTGMEQENSNRRVLQEAEQHFGANVGLVLQITCPIRKARGVPL